MSALQKVISFTNRIEELAFIYHTASLELRQLGFTLDADESMKIADRLSSDARFCFENRPGAPIDLTKKPQGVRT